MSMGVVSLSGDTFSQIMIKVDDTKHIYINAYKCVCVCAWLCAYVHTHVQILSFFFFFWFDNEDSFIIWFGIILKWREGKWLRKKKKKRKAEVTRIPKK